MAEMKINNNNLEDLLKDFAEDRQKEKYAKIMEALEGAIVLVPSQVPQNMDEEAKNAMKEGKPVQIPKGAQIMPCLLRKETGEFALPIFTTAAQIPQEKKSPALLAMPFFGCLAMIMSNREKLQAVILNPFTHNVMIPWQLLEVAEKRRNAAAQTKTIKVTEKQFQDLVHNQVAVRLLPKYLFEQKEAGLQRLQKEEGAFLLTLYEGLYPQGKKAPFREDDFSTMTLNISENLQLTRIDMPDEAMKKGMCYRAYAVWKRDTQEILYYTLEKTKEGNFIGQVKADGTHERVEEAPDNGAEIEAIMGIASRM